MRSVIVVLFILFFLQSGTALRLVILNPSDQPIVNVRIVVRVNGIEQSAVTDEQGVANFTSLSSDVVYVQQAFLADGTELHIDPTTPQDGMRLGLVPQQTRNLVLRFDPATQLIFIDPAALFSGEVIHEKPSTQEQPVLIEQFEQSVPFATTAWCWIMLGLISMILLSIWFVKIYQYQHQQSKRRP